MPAERELAARCGVSRETVRQALHELLVAGRVERRGRGTVVARPKMVQPLSLGSYTEGALSQGREPGESWCGGKRSMRTPNSRRFCRSASATR